MLQHMQLDILACGLWGISALRMLGLNEYSSLVCLWASEHPTWGRSNYTASTSMRELKLWFREIQLSLNSVISLWRGTMLLDSYWHWTRPVNLCCINTIQWGDLRTARMIRTIANWKGIVQPRYSGTEPIVSPWCNACSNGFVLRNPMICPDMNAMLPI